MEKPYTIVIEFHLNESTTIHWATDISSFSCLDCTSIRFIDNSDTEWRSATFSRFIDGYSGDDGIYDELYIR